MRIPRRTAVAGLGALLALAGCAAPRPAAVAPARPQTVVVLLAEADGSVGRVTVANGAGERTLDQAGQATGVLAAGSVPTEPATLTPGEIAAQFGPALSAQPAPPLHFVLYFERDTTELTPESRAGFSAVLDAVRQRASVDTSVVGHSDTSGDAKHNLELSLRRALAVGALLAAGGVDPGALDITSHGEANLLVPTPDDVIEPRNRRVEVTVR